MLNDFTSRTSSSLAIGANEGLISFSYVTVSAKTVLNGTFIITRKTDLKYSSCCGSVVLDFSHARFTV